MKKLAIIGSTGSVGTQTLDVITQHADQFEVEGLAAGSNADLFVEQVNKFRPKKASVSTKEIADRVRPLIPSGVELYYGEEGLIEVAAGTEAETVVTAIVGSAGLPATLAAISEGKHIGLANKETLVTAGHLVTGLAKKKGVSLLPVDSEHSAIFQCLNGERMEDVERITLTASGGSFRDLSRDQLQHVTVEDALKHPNWSMGAKITIDSATMVNKGLEVIEARWLFGMSFEQIGVLLHPESIVHSFVEYRDGSVIAQLGTPDMRVPIQYALSYPERWTSSTKRLSLAEVGKLHFREMDMVRYPCLRLAFECGKIGGTATSVYNAANEVAVARFLNREISFLQIEHIIESVLSRHEVQAEPDLDAIKEADRWARETARSL
ncbi:1-deoxy-D-xylulose-5-phosphate reductoisomerase [Paenibacillus sp. Marseille-P2973]|uniref:1-deoxy-D-xylulose-5-phosphate reductoisomerase n=1 Tax=Paenibacillus sp. Marseille-P2973 TaxID=1871032 RepID=UPI001B394BCA|nr:1-deoxy-D-xylulose-5-phosphate reductoisomerase [Paenibacillus sp. Marseille-P2973]MBQ4898975.1 1-deoxy-D-xylulose-5-phosphate reductoisomerase [Paenibacillus sp. Marseille-P2973]